MSPLKNILLDETLLANLLKKQGFVQPFKLNVFNSIDSTNQYLKHQSTDPTVAICCAEQQTQGRGRFSRHWHSPFGENIYCSSRWNLDCSPHALSGLSLVASLATLATIKEFCLEDIKIKWPNDLLWQNKKLCGSLIEIIESTPHHAQVIIGIGININSDTINNPLEDKAWCSLYEMTNQYFDRNQIIARLLIQLENYLALFLAHGLGYFLKEWDLVDFLINKHITVTQFNHSIYGKALGINEQGQLILEDEKGVKHSLCSGDTTLKQGN